MKVIIETMASTQFFLFALGVFGVKFFEETHKLISKCNSTVFSYACVILTYVVITYLVQI